VSGIGRPQTERLAAIALAALGGFCGLLLWRDAELLEQQGQHQRELLAQLAAARATAASLSPGPLSEFDGLFSGLHVVCAATPAGHLLQLQPVAPAMEMPCSR
jgi:hypothetical protein